MMINFLHESALTHAEAKYIRNLSKKRLRDEEHVFFAEGPKVIAELLPYFTCRLMVGTAEWLSENSVPDVPVRQVAPDMLRRLSQLQTPQHVLAIFEQPHESDAEASVGEGDFALVLDGVQDPGNVGTIIRTADWLGIRTLYASPDTADCFAPKVVQATMGALGRVRVRYTDVPKLLARWREEGRTVCGTFMEGESVYDATLTKPLAVVMGNEGRGIRPETLPLLTRRLSIPRFGDATQGGESLNVAVATAIVCAELRRKGL